MMFERLIDSEKFSHLGQLAANVTQQLNNPLTVVLGYASLLEETSTLDAQDRKAVESILAEAAQYARPRWRAWRASPGLTATSRLRFQWPSCSPTWASCIALSSSAAIIEFRLSIAPALPRVLCSAQQLRQACSHCLQFAMDAVEGTLLQVRLQLCPLRLPAQSRRPFAWKPPARATWCRFWSAHPGPGFPNPERAFDPFAHRRSPRGNRQPGTEPLRHHPPRQQRPRLGREPGAPGRSHHP